MDLAVILPPPHPWMAPAYRDSRRELTVHLAISNILFIGPTGKAPIPLPAATKPSTASHLRRCGNRLTTRGT